MNTFRVIGNLDGTLLGRRQEIVYRCLVVICVGIINVSELKLINALSRVILRVATIAVLIRIKQIKRPVIVGDQ